MQSDTVMNKFTFPLRLKVLITVLAFLMAVVGVITATMADLFEQDKTTYVRDFSVVVTSDAQNEVDLILGGYVKPVFEAYPQILGIVTTNSADKPVSIYNASALETYDTNSSELVTFASLLEGGDGMHVHGAALLSGQSVVTLTLDSGSVDQGKGRALVMILTPELFHRALRRNSAFEGVLINASGDAVIRTANGFNRPSGAPSGTTPRGARRPPRAGLRRRHPGECCLSDGEAIAQRPCLRRPRNRTCCIDWRSVRVTAFHQASGTAISRRTKSCQG